MSEFRRRLMMQSGGTGGKYIKFADPVVEQLCMKWSSDGIGLTPEDAAKVASIGTTFQRNTEITSFEELEMFTGISEIPLSAFAYCGNLKSISIPIIRRFDQACFYGCSKLMDVHLHSETPPYLSINVFGGARNAIVYVPDESIQAYKNQTDWATKAGRIVGMSYKERLTTDNYERKVGQSYGNVNGNINFTTDKDYEWVKIPIGEVGSVVVRRPETYPSSLIQYVDSNGKILHLDATDNPEDVSLYEIVEITGATHVYVSSAAGTMRIYGKPKE